MSDVLTIAGIPVPIQAPLSEELEEVGEEFRTEGGALASQVRAEKRVWSATTGYLTRAEVATLKAAIALRAPVTVVLTLDGSSETMTARVRALRELQQNGLFFVRLIMREV